MCTDVLREAPNKQLQRTVTGRCWTRGHAAADLRRYATNR
jgi:hypothetical protein